MTTESVRMRKILAGVQRPTSGKILLDGVEIHPRSPLEATRLGVGMIFQELNLCDNLSVVDNIFLARETTRRNGLIARKSQKERAGELLRKLEQKIDPDELLGNLRIGEQQIVEIAKALAQDVRILIMDEPTSALSASEVEVLFRVIRELKSHGVAIIYISHKLEELMQIGDYVTILRDGRKVAEEEIKNVTMGWMIENMVGRNPAVLFTHKEHQSGDVLLKAEDLTLPRSGGGYLLDHVSFELRAGEVLGFYGLMGAGRSDLVECLAGARPQATGSIWLDGQPVTATTILERIQSGFVLIPEDRQHDTMALGAQAALDAAGKSDVIVVGFDGSDDVNESILAGKIDAGSLQPVAEMAIQAAIQADQYIRTGKTGKPEKQSIDMVLLTPENACQYTLFAPNGKTSCP